MLDRKKKGGDTNVRSFFGEISSLLKSFLGDFRASSISLHAVVVVVFKTCARSYFLCVWARLVG